MAITAGVVGVVGSVGSSILGGIGAGKAAKAQAAAQQDALKFEKGVYTDAQGNFAPWIQGGQEALGGVEQFLGLGQTGGGQGTGSGALASYHQFEKTPFYTFPLAQQQESMNRQAASKGMSLSPGQVASLGNYAGQYSSQNFMSYINALNQLSGVGVNAATSLGNIGTNISQQVAGTETKIGAANAQAASAPYTMGSNILGDIVGGIKGLAGSGGGTGTGYTEPSRGQPWPTTSWSGGQQYGSIDPNQGQY